ncbi:rhomboid family intramembrane serine protease [Methanoplanus sp. FWC-SCC4]|uniref:Rhomboid family intramembrane serine protease n=1 Tax=Methanochimaera problematica TaxID=2609417 RepID=A0AA97FDN2_9EURY|nr:rhomboid family intramembrane serine protease [Methanoplanus sp. FWC-SCC4]WOF17034.1 rhomboid family intramembrane serine protease [Methanoplanus sp. FWC-SCC4]
MDNKQEDQNFDDERSAGDIRKINLIHGILFLLMVICVPAILYLLQSFVINGSIPDEIVIKYFILDYDDPNFVSYFLSNYIHNPLNPGHIEDNLRTFILISVVIYGEFFLVFPALDLHMPKKTVPIIYFIFFFLVPFSVSGISVIFRNTGGFADEVKYSLGFSGIVWEFMGFLMFLSSFMFARLITRKICRTSHSEKSVNMEYFPFLFFVAFLIFIPVYIIIFDINSNVNPFAHLAGFSYGWLIPPVVASMLIYGDIRHKVSNIILILLLTGIPVLTSFAI